jgi:hypothetical protein
MFVFCVQYFLPVNGEKNKTIFSHMWSSLLLEHFMYEREIA